MNENEHNDWLASLKVGDEVVEYGGFTSKPMCVSKIERVTPTQLIVNRGRYYRKNGRLVGSDPYCPGHIGEATPKNREAVEKRLIVQRAIVFQWSTLDMVELRALDAVMTSTKARKVKP